MCNVNESDLLKINTNNILLAGKWRAKLKKMKKRHTNMGDDTEQTNNEKENHSM